MVDPSSRERRSSGRRCLSASWTLPAPPMPLKKRRVAEEGEGGLMFLVWADEEDEEDEARYVLPAPPRPERM